MERAEQYRRKWTRKWANTFSGSADEAACRGRTHADDGESEASGSF
jgi:hypothetical protein